MARTLLATVTGATDAECFTCSHSEGEGDEGVCCALFRKTLPDRYRLPECIEAERAAKMERIVREQIKDLLEQSGCGCKCGPDSYYDAEYEKCLACRIAVVLP